MRLLSRFLILVFLLSGLVGCKDKSGVVQTRTEVMLAIHEAEAARRVLEHVRAQVTGRGHRDPSVADAEFVSHRSNARVARLRAGGDHSAEIDAFLRRKDVRQNLDNERGEMEEAMADLDLAKMLDEQQLLDALGKTSERLDKEWSETWERWNEEVK